ncbi:MAG: hypothetical protein RR988_00410 [Clostridia bacterium]
MNNEATSVLATEATKALAKKEYTVAIAKYKEILLREPSNYNIRFKLLDAVIYTKDEHYAESLFESLIYLEDISNAHKLILCKYYIYVLKAYALAESLCDEVISTNPNGKLVNELLATLYMETNRPKLEVEKYAYLASISPEYFINLLDVYMRINDQDMMLYACNKCIENNLADFLPYVLLETVYEAKEDMVALNELHVQMRDKIIQSKSIPTSLRAIYKYSSSLKKGRSVLSLSSEDYLKKLVVKKAAFKNKKTEAIATEQLKYISNMQPVLSFMDIQVFNIRLNRVGKDKYEGKKKGALDYVTIVTQDGGVSKILDFFPSGKIN